MVSFRVAAALVAIATVAQGYELKTMTYMGCYKSSVGLKFNNTDQFQTSGACQKVCVPDGKDVLATTGGSDCWCGDYMPPKSAKVADSNCDQICNGYKPEMCMLYSMIALFSTNS
jgi:cell wall integrity and stress response component